MNNGDKVGIGIVITLIGMAVNAAVISLIGITIILAALLGVIAQDDEENEPE